MHIVPTSVALFCIGMISILFLSHTRKIESDSAILSKQVRFECDRRLIGYRSS